MTSDRDATSKQRIVACIGLTLLVGAAVFMYLSGGFRATVPPPKPVPLGIVLPEGADPVAFTPEETSRIQNAFLPYRRHVVSASLTFDSVKRGEGTGSPLRLQYLMSIETNSQCELVTRMMRSGRDGVVDEVVYKIHAAFERYIDLTNKGLLSSGRHFRITDL
ncbi:MAG: hypothetical protein AB7E47_16930 [Desulfovibrionaceae bacterium]